MFPRFRFALNLAAVCGGALLIVPSVHAAPAKVKPAVAAVAALKLDGWNYEMSDDELENRWSFRATPTSFKTGEARAVFGWKDARNFALLRVTPAFVELWNVENGAARKLGQSARGAGEIGLQVQAQRVRVLLANQSVIEAKLKLAGQGFGVATQGGWAWDASDVQPTADVVFRDDFMRAQGPGEAEIPSEWTVESGWQTLGSTRPRADDALNPNPFIFRASLEPNVAPTKEAVARAGRWFWSDYAFTASVRATANSDGAPLVAALEAFGGAGQNGIVAEIDFRANVARIRQGVKVLAQSAPFDTQAGQWHRVRFEPGPGTARLLIDGIERVSAPDVKLAQGEIALRALAGGANLVDFDDIWVAPATDKKGWGEGNLPERFQKDRLMKNWASPAAAWKRGADGTWWNTGDFFGASQVSLPIPALADGAGLSLNLGARAGEVSTKFIVARVGNDVNLGFAGGVQTKLPLDAATGKGITVESVPAGAGEVVSRALFNGKEIGKQTDKRVAGGVKIGVTPLKNGVPLGAVAPEPISLTSSTFEREGNAIIGVNITPVTAQIARENGLPDAIGAIVDNVEADSPASKAGVQIGDVVVGVNAQNVVDVDSMKTAVSAVKPGESVKIDLLRARRDGSGIDWEHAFATTDAMLDYNFTTAPTDWRAARGHWDVTERWTCSPQWSFFGGGNSDAPLLWSRFQTQGDWTLEAFLATPMDLARGERSPVDLNVGVGGDGKDLASGYSFGFGTNTRKNSTIWRGDEIVSQKPFELPPGLGTEHQDWFYVRLEKRQVGKSVNFKWSVNGREIASYTDDNPLPDGGKLAFWSKNGGISIASARLWNSGLTAPKVEPFAPMPAPRTIENPLGKWDARGAGGDVSALVLPVVATQKLSNPKPEEAAKLFAEMKNPGAVQIINPQSGGDWTTYITRTPFAPAQHPSLEWDYKMDAGVKLNLYAKIDGEWREIVWSGGKSDNETLKSLGRFDAVADGAWHRASFDLLTAMRQNGLEGKSVEALAFAAPDREYLRAGLGGNHLGAKLELRGFAAPVLVAKAE